MFAIPSCNVWGWFYRQNLFTDLLPRKIETIGSVSTADGNILDTCFFGVYKLSDSTLNKISREGLAFFDDATKSRGYFKEGRRSMGMYDVYSQWQQTPIQNTNDNRSFGSGLECALKKGYDENLVKKIELESYRVGAFYTGHREGQLVIFPSLGIAVLSGLGD